jgi:hypothetical protein
LDPAPGTWPRSLVAARRIGIFNPQESSNILTSAIQPPYSFNNNKSTGSRSAGRFWPWASRRPLSIPAQTPMLDVGGTRAHAMMHSTGARLFESPGAHAACGASAPLVPNLLGAASDAPRPSTRCMRSWRAAWAAAGLEAELRGHRLGAVDAETAPRAESQV